jgi:hypothetical protein
MKQNSIESNQGADNFLCENYKIIATGWILNNQALVYGEKAEPFS